MDQIPTPTFTFTSKEIDFLRSKRLFSVIAEQIDSTRPQGRKTLSSKYVSEVIRSKVDCNSSTATTIKSLAKKYLQQFNITNDESI